MVICQALKAVCCLYHLLKRLTFQPLCGIFQHCDLCSNSLYVCSGEKQSLPDGKNRNSWHVFNFRWSCPLLWGLQLLPNARDSWQVAARDSIDIQPEETWSEISSLQVNRHPRANVSGDKARGWHPWEVTSKHSASIS